MKKSTRYVAVGGLVALLLATGYLNYALNASDDDTKEASTLPTTSGDVAVENETDPSQETSADFYVAFKDDRDEVREKEIAYLDELINDSTSDASIVKEAQQKKLNITTAMEKEMIIEGLLKAKGFEKAVVTINDNSINVVVDREQISETEAAQILDIVQRESGEKADNIKIMTGS
jgi:stage III sporulation protein AH